MKVLVVLVALASISSADYFTPPDYTPNTAYGYLERIGIPAAERIHKAEEELLNNPGRIVGGVPAGLGQYPYHVSREITLDTKLVKCLVISSLCEITNI